MSREAALRIDRHEVRRGRLVDASQVAQMIGGDPPPTPEWVCRNVPGKLDMGHRTKRWFADEVWEWIATRREVE